MISKPPARRQALKLGPRSRWILGMVGALGLGAGATAVFTREVEAGPVALLALGALFFLIGILGVMPTRLKIGDNEADWTEAVGDAFGSVIDAVPPENLPQVEEAIIELSTIAPEVANRARTSMLQEQILMGRVVGSVARLGLGMGVEPLHVPGGGRPDAVVTGPNGQKVWVITHARYLKAWELDATTALLPSIRNLDETFTGVLLVSMTRNDHDSSRTIRTQHGTVWVTVVRKGEEGQDIDDAFIEAFGLRS